MESDKRKKLSPAKLKKKSIAIHTCPICGARLPGGKKLEHFKAIHPEYKISRHRIDSGHTAYKCGICGVILTNFKQVMDHFAVVHPLKEKSSAGEAWLDELIRRLEQRKALIQENQRLTEENKRLKEQNAELVQKLVKAQILMSRPEH